MNRNRPFINVFKTPGASYVYDVNTNSILRSTPSVCEFLKEGDLSDQSSLNAHEQSLIQSMQADGYLKDNPVEEIIHSMDESVGSYLDGNLGSMILQVTQNCNLRCSYCAYSGKYHNRGHADLNMRFETAKKGIDFLIEHSIQSRRINVSFYGGEPLLVFDFVKQCIEYAEEAAEGKELNFNITVNGTLLTDAVVEYFMKHKVRMMISIDGPREIHDKNRRFAANDQGTYDVIAKNVRRIRDKYPEYIKNIMFNMVLDSTNNYSCLKEFVSAEDFLQDSILMATGINDRNVSETFDLNMDFFGKQNYEYFKVLLNRIGKYDKANISKLMDMYSGNLDMTAGTLSITRKKCTKKFHPNGPCVPGASRLFMDVYGYFYPCERVSETSDVMKIGHIDQGFDLEKVRTVLNVGKVTEEACIHCWSGLYCTLCAADADNGGNFSKEVKLPRCGGVRAMTERIFSEICALNEMGYKFNKQKQIPEYL